MPQKVCIRKKWSIFVVYLKWARILKKKYQRVQQMLIRTFITERGTYFNNKQNSNVV